MTSYFVSSEAIGSLHLEVVLHLLFFTVYRYLPVIVSATCNLDGLELDNLFDSDRVATLVQKHFLIWIAMFLQCNIYALSSDSPVQQR